MAKQKSTPKQPILPNQTVVVLDGGLMHKGALQRVMRGVERIPDVTAILADAMPAWGPGGKWTSDDVRTLIVTLVGEGMSLPNALKKLQEAGGTIPALSRVRAWMKELPFFSEAMEAAKASRAEVLAEAALDVAFDCTGETAPQVAAAKLQVMALQWAASKYDRGQFGEKTLVDVQHHAEKLSDEDLERRIQHLLNDPLVKGELGMEEPKESS